MRERARQLAAVTGAIILGAAVLIVDPMSGTSGPEPVSCQEADCIGECACVWGPELQDYFCEYWENASACNSDSDCPDS